MRTKLAAVATVLGLAALSGAANASDPPGYVNSGHGKYIIQPFSFAVASDVNFGNVRGSLHLAGPVYNFDAKAVCLNVSGNQATAGYAITDGSFAGQGFEAATQRGTPTSSPQGEILWYGFLPTPPTSCPAPSAPPPTAFFGGPINDGQIAVGTRGLG